MWADLKFPPINLHNVWPTKAALDIHTAYTIRNWYGSVEVQVENQKEPVNKIHPGAKEILGYATIG